MDRIDITLDRVQASLTPHLPVYAWRRPAYQTEMLAALAALWDPAHRRILDVGGGTGVIAQAVKDLFPVDEVVSVDVENRYVAGLTIHTRTYDGVKLPFPDGAFDAVTINNVLHHVPAASRSALLIECRRVAPGGLYIKDHLARSALDHGRLTVLDWIGNVPFAGMLSAEYLTETDWRRLAQSADYAIEATRCGVYRGRSMAAIFPNRLETSMFWRPVLL
jgi:ubiquinone/menaquinone biosynthesis C-methylase UbiE